MAEVTRWLPRIFVSACRKPSRVRPSWVSRRPAAVAEPSASIAMMRCSTETYSSLSLRDSCSAVSSRRASRCVILICPGFTPGPLTLGRLASSASSAVRSRSGSAPGLAEQPGNDALGLVKQGEQQMLNVHLGVPEAKRLGLRVVQCFLRFLRQVARVHVYLPGRRAPRRAVSSTAIRSSRSVTSPTAA